MKCLFFYSFINATKILFRLNTHTHTHTHSIWVLYLLIEQSQTNGSFLHKVNSMYGGKHTQLREDAGKFNIFIHTTYKTNMNSYKRI